MLWSWRRRAARTFGSVLSVAPNRRSNTTRGLFSVIKGSVGVSHEIVLLYAQLYPTSQDPTRLLSSICSWRDESCVSRSNALAAIWSIEMPPSTTVSDFFTCTPLRYAPLARE